MLNAKRKLRWGRAWVAVGFACAVMCLPIVASAQAGRTGDQSPTAPAGASAPTQASPQPAAVSASDQSQDAASSQDAAATPDSGSSADQSGTEQPVAKNLETGLPLRSVMSPLHWGHLSLLSFEGFEAYNTDYRAQAGSLGSQLTALQGLVVYSIQRSKSTLDLQYRPYVWFSQQTTYKDFTANSVDFVTSHTFNRRWSITGNEDFQYSPNPANTLQSAFATDFVSNTSNETPFLLAGRKSLMNNVDITINRQLSESSRLSLNLVDNFVRVSAPSGVSDTNLPGIAERMNAYGGGLTFSRRWNSRTSMNVSYNYRRQQLTGFAGNSSFNTVDVGFSRVLKPSLTLTAQAGPGWSNSGLATKGAVSQRRTTAQGSAELFKSFRNGGVALAFYRNSEFSGVISNSYSNHYDLSFNRRLFTRWNFQASGSYIQQEYVGKRVNTGELGWAELGYMLSRNWSLFGGYRYLNLSGNPILVGTQQLIAGGIRWAWQPETTHK
jgi:hypothetical protein